MSGQRLALLLALAVISAAIGAGAAVLVRESDEPTQSHAVAVVGDGVSEAPVQEEPDSISVAQPEQLSSQSAPRPVESDSEEPSETPEAAAVETRRSVPESVKAAGSAPSSSSSSPVAAGVVTDADDSASARSLEPTPAPEPEPQVVVSVTPNQLTQGEAFALTVATDAVEEVEAVAVTAGGRSWNLTEVEPGDWWGIVAIPRDWRTGQTEIVVDLHEKNGVWLNSAAASLLVLANTAPLEEIVLGGAGVAADAAAIQRDHDVRFVDHVGVSGPPRWSGPWLIPVVGEVSGVFGSRRTYDGVPGDSWHHGHDIAANQGDPIVAPAAGVVVWTGELIVHGIGVIIDHGAGVYSGYWHMSLIAVREGMEVAPGDWIGNIGSTGLSTGPHLHWEVIVQGIDVDPVQWLGSDQPPTPRAFNSPTSDAVDEEAAETVDTLD